MSAPRLQLFQIAYSDATAAAVASGFALLDNRANPRPDWFEFDPIRRFLRSQPLDEATLYGFFSPKFGAKTGYTAADLHALAARHPQADVLLASAHPNQVAFFVNVFEQGEFFHPGLMAAAEAWLAQAGIRVSLAGLVMDVRQTVFCNYFAARPAFWREWLKLAEHLHALCESPQEASPLQLQQQLTSPAAGYHGGAQLKVFLVERIASLLLALQPQWQSAAADPYAHGRWPSPALQADPTDAIASDALKLAMRQARWPQYAQAFGALRQRVLSPAAA